MTRYQLTLENYARVSPEWRPRGNRGEWWVAVTVRSLNKVIRDFKTENVASLLYETVGDVRPRNETFNGYETIHIQLKWPKGYDPNLVEACLEDLGIGLLEKREESAQ